MRLVSIAWQRPMMRFCLFLPATLNRKTPDLNGRQMQRKRLPISQPPATTAYVLLLRAFVMSRLRPLIRQTKARAFLSRPLDLAVAVLACELVLSPISLMSADRAHLKRRSGMDCFPFHLPVR